MPGKWYIHPSLCNVVPDLLPPIIGYPFRPLSIRYVQCRLPSLYICFFRFDPPCALEDLPENKEHSIHSQARICSDEVLEVKSLRLARKRIKATEHNNHGEETEGEPGGIGLKWRLEDEGVAADALSAQSIVKFDVCNRDGHPGQGKGNCRNVLEPLKGFLRASGARHVGQQGDGCSNADAPVWKAPGEQTLAGLAMIQEIRECDLLSGACQQKPWRLAVLPKCVKIAGSRVEVTISSRGC